MDIGRRELDGRKNGKRSWGWGIICRKNRGERREIDWDLGDGSLGPSSDLGWTNARWSTGRFWLKFLAVDHEVSTSCSQTRLPVEG